MEVKKKGKKTRNDAAFAVIAAVEKGKSIIFLKKDWKMGTLPGQNIIRRRIGREFKVETLKDESGWKITAL